jgi:hypothetical protein
MNGKWRGFFLSLAAIAFLAMGTVSFGESWLFDCGTDSSAVMKGYQKLTADDAYDSARGFGWETRSANSIEFGPCVSNPEFRGSYGRPTELSEWLHEERNALSSDGVVSDDELIFRIDVPPGAYRVTAVIGDMSQAIGSMDVSINGKMAEEHAAAWAVGCYRLLHVNPAGWWTPVRATAEAKDGAIRIALKKNQSDYDKQMAEQAAWETPYAQWYHKTPVLTEPPYYFIGFPFVHNSVMAIEIKPAAPPIVECANDKLSLSKPVDSPSLDYAIAAFNKKDFLNSLAALPKIKEPEAQAAKAAVGLYLAGRLEIEAHDALVANAIEVLGGYVSKNPGDTIAAEWLEDAEVFQRAQTIHRTRGQIRKNHFVENDKAFSLWQLIQEDSPLFYKSQLCAARAARMLHPYFPTMGTEGEILKRLEKKFPDNRFVKYFLHKEWEPYGDGSQFDDWSAKDYTAEVADAPQWVQSLYPAWNGVLDWAEWFIKFKQYPEGTIGGGWGDDVEVIGNFAYQGFTSRGVSELAVQGARNLVDGLLKYSEVDPEIGYCLPCADAEHSAEWTGNTLGMMAQIDYGNPRWIEESMKTAKLLRDLWTDYDVNGGRHFRANYIGATMVGTGGQANDSWINYRALRPATAVWNYNQNPTIGKLYKELADAWLVAALSNDRGKPRGVIPAEVSFPGAIAGGVDSPNWFTAFHGAGTINADWFRNSATYKNYLNQIFFIAYEQTGNARYFEPLRLEYKLAEKYGLAPDEGQALRLELPREWQTPVSQLRDPGPEIGDPGSEKWVAHGLGGLDKWLEAQSVMNGRSGELKNDISKDDIVRFCGNINEKLHDLWPLMTTESSATDRVDFHGSANAFAIYTGGGYGGAFMEAPITYENTTRKFAAAVMANDAQGFRILYYSLTPDSRAIGIVPWKLEPGARYKLRYGPDADGNEKMDSVLEEREFVFPQRGAPIPVKVDPRVTYVIEADQIERIAKPGLAPDPGLSAEDIRYSEQNSLLIARVHNVGSRAARDVEVAFYNGDPGAGGELIEKTYIPNIQAPIDLEPRAVSISVHWDLPAKGAEVFVVIDPDDKIKNEITTFNNKASKKLSRDPEFKKKFLGEA